MACHSVITGNVTQKQHYVSGCPNRLGDRPQGKKPSTIRIELTIELATVIGALWLMAAGQSPTQPYQRQQQP